MLLPIDSFFFVLSKVRRTSGGVYCLFKSHLTSLSRVDAMRMYEFVVGVSLDRCGGRGVIEKYAGEPASPSPSLS